MLVIFADFTMIFGSVFLDKFKWYPCFRVFNCTRILNYFQLEFAHLRANVSCGHDAWKGCSRLSSAIGLRGLSFRLEWRQSWKWSRSAIADLATWQSIDPFTIWSWSAGYYFRFVAIFLLFLPTVLLAPRCKKGEMLVYDRFRMKNFYSWSDSRQLLLGKVVWANGWCSLYKIIAKYQRFEKTPVPKRTTNMSTIAIRAKTMIQHILHLLFYMAILALSMLASARSMSSLALRTLSPTWSIFSPVSLVKMPMISKSYRHSPICCSRYLISASFASISLTALASSGEFCDNNFCLSFSLSSFCLVTY